MTNDYTCISKQIWFGLTLNAIYFYGNPRLESLVNEANIINFLNDSLTFKNELLSRNFTYLLINCPDGYIANYNFDSCIPCPNYCNKCYFAYLSSNVWVNFTEIQLTNYKNKNLMDEILMGDIHFQMFCEECRSASIMKTDNISCIACSTIDSNCSVCDYAILNTKTNELTLDRNGELYCLNCTKKYGIVQKTSDNLYNYKKCIACKDYCDNCLYLDDLTHFCLECAMNNYNNGSNNRSILDWNTGKCYFLSLPFLNSDGIEYVPTLPQELPYYHEAFPEYGKTDETNVGNSYGCEKFGRVQLSFVNRFLFCMICSSNYYSYSYSLFNTEFKDFFCVDYYSFSYYSTFEKLGSENLTQILKSPIYKYKLDSLMTLEFMKNESNYLFYQPICNYTNLQLNDGSRNCRSGPEYGDPTTCFYKNQAINLTVFQCESCVRYWRSSIIIYEVFAFLRDYTSIEENGIMNKFFKEKNYLIEIINFL